MTAYTRCLPIWMHIWHSHMKYIPIKEPRLCTAINKISFAYRVNSNYSYYYPVLECMFCCCFFFAQYRPLQKCLNFVIAEGSVIVTPSKEMRRKPVRVKLGETWNATCKATGNPAPRIKWRKKNSNNTLRTTQHGNKGVKLKIDTLAEEDLGIYLCVAENSVGKDNTSIELGELSLV